jgi:hypothetical protein
LRLIIKGSLSRERKSGFEGALGSSAVSSWVSEKGILDTSLPWIQAGLREMSSLRVLEIEIGDKRVSREVKIEFCKELMDILGCRVLFVERIEMMDQRGRDASDEFRWIGGLVSEESLAVGMSA